MFLNFRYPIIRPILLRTLQSYFSMFLNYQNLALLRLQKMQKLKEKLEKFLILASFQVLIALFF